MRDFKKRRLRREDVLRSIVGMGGIVVLGAVAFFAARGAYNMYGKFAAAAAARTEAEADLKELEARYATIEAEVDDFTSSRGVEAEVRERYGVAKPGEGKIDIVRTSTTTGSSAAPHDTLWERLWHLLFVW